MLGRERIGQVLLQLSTSPQQSVQRNLFAGHASEVVVVDRLKRCIRAKKHFMNRSIMTGQIRHKTVHKIRLQAKGLVHFQDIEDRSEEHTSELQSLMRISYAVFCL